MIEPGSGDGSFADFGTHRALFANMTEIGREAVAQIDHGMSNALLAQELTYNEARSWQTPATRASIFPVASRIKSSQLSSCSPQLPSYIDAISNPRTGAQNSSTPWNGSNHDNVGKDFFRRFGCIAPRQRDSESRCEPHQTREKSINPRLGQIPGHPQREKRSQGNAAHRSNVTQAAKQRPMSNRGRRRPVSAKVNVLQTEIGSDQNFVASRNSQHGRIIADSMDHRAGPRA